MTLLGPEEAELKALECAFRDAWDAAEYPVVYGDNEFKGERTKSWVRLSVLAGTPDRVDLGNSAPMHEFVGVILVQCFIVRTGDSPQWIAAKLTKLVREIFQDKNFVTETNGHIICFTTGCQRVAPEASWARFNIRTPYRRNEVFS
jgi:hypothetical protein